jgi:hypothetical protein
LKFPIYSSQVILKSIQGVEIDAAVDVHLAAAKPPVSAQEEMVAKYIVIEIIQRAASDFQEIRNIILVQSGIGHFLVLAVARHKADLAHEFFLVDALTESAVAGSKNSAKHAVARPRTAPADA